MRRALTHLPDIVEPMLELVSDRRLAFVVSVELRIARIEIVGYHAVRIGQNRAVRRQKVTRRVGPVLQIGRIECQRRGGVRLQSNGRRERHTLVRVRTDLRVAVARDTYHAVRQRAVLVDLVADIERDLLARIVADLHFYLSDAFNVGELALHVDDRARIALSVEHRCRTAQSAQTVDHIQVDAPAREIERIGHRQAIDEQRRREAAHCRVPIGAIVRAVGRETRYVTQRVWLISVARVISICWAVTTLMVCGISSMGVSVLVPVTLRRATSPAVASAPAVPGK